MRAEVGGHRADPGHAKTQTYGEQVRAGVARAALLDRLLHEPRVIATVDALPSIASATGDDGCLGRAGDPVARAVAAAQLAASAQIVSIDRLTALTHELGLDWLGPWLPEFLEAAAHFRRTLEAEDLPTCALADPGLSDARAFVRSRRQEPERFPWARTVPVLRLLGGLLPTTEPTDWLSRTPDWIELFAILVEHAAERIDWSSEATGAERLWPFLLWSTFVGDIELGDDPEVLHGLVGLWATTCHRTIDEHTRPRPPRGRVPGSSGFYADGRLREGGRDKLRRWVGWYVDRDIRHVPLNEILRAAFPDSTAPLERASEVRRHISDAKHLLALELPLDASQAVRLWKLAQSARPLLACLPSDGG